MRVEQSVLERAILVSNYNFIKLLHVTFYNRNKEERCSFSLGSLFIRNVGFCVPRIAQDCVYSFLQILRYIWPFHYSLQLSYHSGVLLLHTKVRKNVIRYINII